MLRCFLLVLLLVAPVPAQSEGEGEGAGRFERYDGLVAPGRVVELRAPLEGLVAEVAVTEGDTVGRGEVLLAMDDALQQVATEAARLQAASDAAIRRAQAAADLAANTLERVRMSHQAGAAGDWEVAQAQTQVAQAQAEYDLAVEQQRLAAVELRLEEERLRRYQLRAPFAGVVTRVEVEPGATLTGEEKVITLVSLDPLEATLHLPAEMQGQLHVGKMYELRASTPVDRVVAARLRFVDPAIDPASRTVRCLLEMDNADHALPAGFSVTLVSPTPAGEGR